MSVMSVPAWRGAPSRLAAVGLGIGWVLMGQPAEAFSPFVKYVENVSAYNALSPKVARAVCPGGYSVLGGAALIIGADGRVAVQAAFPTHDDSIWQDVYIVKAASEEENDQSWSVTAGAYCTPTLATQKQFVEILFDSDPIKQVTIACPSPLKVVGMGGEVSKQHYEHPTNDPVTVPPPTTSEGTGVVFQGFEVSPGQTSVTAYAIEKSAVLHPDYDYTGD